MFVQKIANFYQSRQIFNLYELEGNFGSIYLNELKRNCNELKGILLLIKSIVYVSNGYVKFT